MIKCLSAVPVQGGKLGFALGKNLGPEFGNSSQLLLSNVPECVGFLEISHVRSVPLEDVNELIGFFTTHQCEVSLVELKTIVIEVLVISSWVDESSSHIDNLYSLGNSLLEF